MIEFHMTVTPPWREVDYKKISQAVHDSGVLVAEVVTLALNGVVIPGMTKSIHDEQAARGVERHDLGLLEFSVTAPDMVSQYERGKDPWDMKPDLINGPRSRPLKDGKGRYNIIPFKHNEDELPQAVADMSSGLSLSSVIGHYIDGEGKTRNRYEWGSNTGDTSEFTPIVTKPQIGGMERPYTHKASVHSNMYKFSNGLVTFRAVSSRSHQASWWHPAEPENPIMKSVEDVVTPLIEARLNAAWREELNW